MANVYDRLEAALEAHTLTPTDVLFHVKVQLRHHAPVGEPFERYWAGVLTEVERSTRWRNDESETP